MDDIPLCRPNIFCGRLSRRFLLESGMPENVCPELWMCENTRILQKLSMQSAAAGATHVTVPTFGANRVALEKYGLGEKCAEINRTLFSQVREAAFPQTILGAGLGSVPVEYDPDGICETERLIDIYREQIEVLAECGAEYFYFASMSSLEQMRAGVIAAKEFGLPVFLTVAANEDGRTADGAQFLPCLLTLQKLGVDAFGIDGVTAFEEVFAVVKNAAQYSEIPFIITADIKNASPSVLKCFYSVGTRYIGATDAENFDACIKLSEIFENNSYAADINKYEVRAAANESEAFFLLDDENLNFSEPLVCSFDLADELIDLDDETINVTVVEVCSKAEAHILSKNVNMSRLPIAIAAANEEILEYSLLLFNGIAIVKSDCDIDFDKLSQIAAKYGAIVI
ncbi:MAG: homocysteine S-methyltransferase family protein [Clostridia bacterium]|nr:homocysteine S-methyltransferase family protein [Clostridia bacterium]